MNASSSSASVERAGQLLAEGKHAQAEAEARAVLARSPGDLGARVVLNASLQFAQRFTEAIPVAESLIESAPQEPAHWMNLGTARRGARLYDAALQAYSRAAALGASGPDFAFNVALTHIERGDLDAARALLSAAREQDPFDGEICFHYAQVCYETLRLDEASAALAQWHTLQRLDTTLIANIGLLLTNLGETRRAEVALRQARADKSAPTGALLTVISVLERTNRLAEARELMDRLLADPKSELQTPERMALEAQLLQREGKHSEAEALFTRSLPGKEEFHRRHLRLFPIARSLDALGRFDDAWRVLVEAHASQVESIQRQSPQWALRALPDMSVTALGCDADDVAAWDHTGAPSTDQSPVFVVGFPRSGTTLLELALDAHPQLRAGRARRIDGIGRGLSPATTGRVARSPRPRARHVLGARREEGEARARRAPRRQEPAEHPPAASHPARVSERAHPARGAPSLRRHPVVLHAAVPRTGFRAAVPEHRIARGRFPPHFQLLVCAERVACARGA